jgi:diguanylate cyclase
MSSQVDLILRSHAGIDLTRRVLDVIEAHSLWPTPLNIELFSHFVLNPNSHLGLKLQELLAANETFSERISLDLANEYLPEMRMADQIRTAETFLVKELQEVSQAIDRAQDSSGTYSDILNATQDRLAVPAEAPAIRHLVETLSAATRQAAEEAKSLEGRLNESVTEVKRLQENLKALRRLVDTDALTNLANRKAFDEEIQRACAEADRSGHSLSVAMIDIDHFKSFNDRWGHQTGDQVIRFVATTIGQFCPPPSLAARYGGEEFGILFHNTSAIAAETEINNLRMAIANRKLKRRASNDAIGQVTVSAGLAQRKLGETPQAFIGRADKALYASKRTGRNKTTNAEAVPIRPLPHTQKAWAKNP